MKQSEIITLVDRIVSGASIQFARDGYISDQDNLIEIARDELEKAGVSLQKQREARILSGQSAEEVGHYLPSNFEAAELPSGDVVVRGYDMHGWTLDGYIIPRLASGLIVAMEKRLTARST